MSTENPKQKLERLKEQRERLSEELMGYPTEGSPKGFRKLYEKAHRKDEAISELINSIESDGPSTMVGEESLRDTHPPDGRKHTFNR